AESALPLPALNSYSEPGTVFEIEAQSAGKVSVAGSFNDWNMNANFLQKDADGKWRTRLNLKPGTYEYKFLQDGDWDKLNKDNRKITVNAGAESALPLPALNSFSEPGTVFEIEAPSAGKVSVAGSFNDWNMNANFLQKDADGKWKTRLNLKPGTYEYKFLQDGDWDKLNKDNRKIIVK
ncbi:glycogen-binding domain-containing protein, partial [Candidatus Dependentiae bacterium]|nr:glycogen-binding domain-containing protein [Candidatus Dependentiae bacterium]